MNLRGFIALLAMSAANTGPSPDSLFVPKEITAYPFVTSTARAALIRENYKQVTQGMGPEDVKVVLGEPDEVRPLYEPKIRNPKQIGNTYWYVLNRVSATGSADHKREAIVRISFNLSARVIAVDHWGLIGAQGLSDTH